jgi:hypothetical protein
MGYTRENFLKRVADVQQTFKEHNRQGMVQEWIYENHIKDKFRIGRTTFYKWLSIPVQRELEKIKTDAENKAKYKQITMDFFGEQP